MSCVLFRAQFYSHAFEPSLVLIAGIRSLVLARDDVTLRHSGVARIAVCIIVAMQITSFAVFIYGPLMDRHPWLRPGI